MNQAANTSSNFYKIEGANEFAYFRANFKQLRRILESDPNWVAGVMEIFGHFGISKSMQKFRNSLFGCAVEEQADNYFIVRGTISLYYKIEAVNEEVSRIIPIGRLPTAIKVMIPFQLALMCVFPVIFTPFYYNLRKTRIQNWSKIHLISFCQYLERRGQQIYGKNTQGEIRR